MKKPIIIVVMLIAGLLGYLWFSKESNEGLWNATEKEMDTRDKEDMANDVSLSDVEGSSNTNSTSYSSTTPKTETPDSDKGAGATQIEISNTINAIAELNSSDTSDPFEGL